MKSRTALSASLPVPFLIPLLAMLSAFPPLATDMYLPAIPHLGDLWDVSPKVINFTLVGFFLGYSPALLIYGPFSDRFGRKAPLLVGLALFILGSFLSASAGSVHTLIQARILQGIGAAGPSALGLSIIKDYFTGPERHKILALIGIIIAIAPMIGPTLGSWILLIGNWHIIFVLQAVVAIISMAGVIKMPESHANPRHIPLIKMAGPYLSLFRNPHFVGLTLLFAASVCSFFAFLAASAEIYITGFHLSEQVFGLLFGVNALSLMMGSYTCMKLSKKINDMVLIQIGFGIVLIGGLLLLMVPHSKALFFTLPMCLISYGFGLTRPLSVNLILETVDQDAGSASSMMLFANFIFGAAAMWIISLGGDWKISLIGLLAVLSGLATLFVLGFMTWGKGCKRGKDLSASE